jgi:hypothetical protein
VRKQTNKQTYRASHERTCECLLDWVRYDAKAARATCVTTMRQEVHTGRDILIMVGYAVEPQMTTQKLRSTSKACTSRVKGIADRRGNSRTSQRSAIVVARDRIAARSGWVLLCGHARCTLKCDTTIGPCRLAINVCLFVDDDRRPDRLDSDRLSDSSGVTRSRISTIDADPSDGARSWYSTTSPGTSTATTRRKIYESS